MPPRANVARKPTSANAGRPHRFRDWSRADGRRTTSRSVTERSRKENQARTQNDKAKPPHAVRIEISQRCCAGLGAVAVARARHEQELYLEFWEISDEHGPVLGRSRLAPGAYGLERLADL